MFKFSLSLLTFFLALTSFSAHAQMADRLSERPNLSKVETAKAAAITREMTNHLRLNEAQFLQLLPLNRTKISGLNAINHLYKDDEATRAAKAAELEAQYEQACSRILTPTQLSQLQQENSTAPTNSGNGLG